MFKLLKSLEVGWFQACLDPGAQSVAWRLTVSCPGLCLLHVASFLDSMCWQEMASRNSRLHHLRFRSSRKEHPCPPGAPARSSH